MHGLFYYYDYYIFPSELCELLVLREAKFMAHL